MDFVYDKKKSFWCNNFVKPEVKTLQNGGKHFASIQMSN